MSRIVNVLDYKFLIPKFVHKFGDLENHTFSGSLNRHIAIEKVLYAARETLNWLGDAMPGYRLLNAGLHLFFGLNCNFPKKDVIRYVVWSLRRGYYKRIK
jgi:hypothetical protein